MSELIFEKILQGEVVNPVESLKAYVTASRQYRDTPNTQTAYDLLAARLKVVRDAPFSDTAEVIKSIPEWNMLLAREAGLLADENSSEQE